MLLPAKHWPMSGDDARREQTPVDERTMISAAMLLSAVVALGAARLMYLPPAGQLDVLSSMTVENPACIEGFFFHKGALYQSNGWYGQSALLRIDAKSGGELKRFDVNARVFAEGIAVLNDTFYQLTYQNQVAFMYRETTTGFELLGNRSYASKEGWGLTTNGSLLIMSDGSSQLSFIDPVSWREVKRIQVYDTTHSTVSWINELEWIRGKIFANHFLTQELLMINPDTGVIEAYFDLTHLNPPRTPTCKCLCGPPTTNGIAYDAVNDRLWVTGKDWPSYYLVRLTFADGTQIGAGGGAREQ